MIIQLLNILRSNNSLKLLLGGTVEDDKIYATHTSQLGECLLYEYHTTAANKITDITRLTITIITDTLSKSSAIEAEVKQSIITLADNKLTNTILQVELNGGGSLYDYDRQKHHRTLYFTILSRSGK